ncbi:MAG: molybdopterin molybdotransferase MoeA [Psychrobium sp.]|nr:molybdopterin molybdotransferase MoeA [Psychrobium sp.]
MKDCFSSNTLLPFDQALDNMLAAIEPVTEQEDISINDAQDRILASDISSPVNVPPYDNSAMDGYAFSHHSFTEQQNLQLFGTSIAGKPFNEPCPPLHCIRIMTGAKMPIGCDTVEMQENATVVEQQIHFSAMRKLGANVRKTGEDIKQGQLVYQRGKRLNAIDLGLLASLGINAVQVYRKLTVALIATGDELKTPSETLNDGEIFESNSHVLSAMLHKLNVKVINFGIVKDEEAALKRAFISADEQADAIISCGGVSVGDADYTKKVLEQLGQIGFWKIAMKPGKPFAFGKLPNSVFFGLPGNPVSATVTAHVLAIPALLKMQNCCAIKPTTLRVICRDALKKRAGRIDFQRGIFSIDDQGQAIVRSTGSQGSGILSSLAQANCYIVLPSEQGNVVAGEIVDVRLFDQFIG